MDDEYPLDGPVILSYREHGHVTLRGVCNAAEITAYRGAIRDAVDELNSETRPLEQRDTYHKAFLQVPNIWRHNDRARRFVMGRRFAKLAADLMGVEGVRLYHDQALFKEPGGGFTPWHQDRYYWPLDTDRTITMWMPLVDAYAGMEFVAGSQTHGSLSSVEISDDSEQFFTDLVARNQMPVHETGALRAGDCTFHDGWSLHRAPGNPTGTMREVMTVIYFADGVRVGEADSDVRANDLATWLPGLEPGDMAASELNPLVYRRSEERQP